MDVQSYEDIFPIHDKEENKYTPIARPSKQKSNQKKQIPKVTSSPFEEEFLYSSKEENANRTQTVSVNKPKIYDKNTNTFNCTLIQAATNIIWGDDESEDENSLLNRSMSYSFEINDPNGKRRSRSIASPRETRRNSQKMFISAAHKKVQVMDPEQIMKDGVRKIYSGVKLDPEEERVLSRFKYFLGLSNDEDKIPNSIFEGDLLALKCLNATGRDFQKTLERIKSIIEWENKEISIDEESEKILNSGMMYSFGRDKDLRPIIVINMKKIKDSKIEMHALVKACHILLKYIKNKLLIPGRVETWLLIVDLDKMNAFSYPRSKIKHIIDEMSLYYPCRLDKMIMINTPKLIRVLWKALSLFFTKSFLKKVILKNKNYKDELLKIVPRNQLECKYGGICSEKVENFFPPR
ncbi:unnamed protein product [Blepharisma stoltei]|uniref:CRAL-TRIO domain-containing protein n=1 Tax=Blepharisma stoltei TaxID=1481888 RepID=A0AAU9KFI9_9CILI|nr:unnamed protein product [Blepharisma stoltei]